MSEAMPQMLKEGWHGQDLPVTNVGEPREPDENGGRLLSTVCHELRTPLAIIRGYTTLLLDYDQKLETREKREYVQSIDRAAGRLADLVDHILDMSRLESGTLHLEKAPIAISDIIQEAAAEARFRGPEHPIRLTQGRSLPRVRVDAKRIRQVLDNVLDNAFKYSGEGTEIVVSAQRREQELLISVSDQGIGVPAGDVERVFERLYRVDPQETAGNRGVGLGLTICRGLVEAHGGRIWLESTEGRGSTVFFTLPL